MKHFWVRLWPRTLAAQLIALLLGAVVLTHVVLAVLLAEERQDAVLSERRGGALARVAAISRILSTTPRENWRDVLRVAQSPQIQLRLLNTPVDYGETSDVTRLLTERINASLGNPPVSAQVSFLSENECRRERDKEEKRQHDLQDKRDRHHKDNDGDLKRKPHRFFGNISCDGPPVMGVAVPVFGGPPPPPVSPAPKDTAPDGGAGRPAASTAARPLPVSPPVPDVAQDRDGAPAEMRGEFALPPHLLTKTSTPVAWLDARINNFSPPPWVVFQSLLRVGLSAILIGIIAFFVARRITRPWKALAVAADRVGRGDFPEPVSESGPLEIRHAARAFNRMTARLRRFVEDRTRMLAAISHDLRTPITSLRLRAEFVEDPENRRKIIETLNEMEQMVAAAMTFAREETADEKTRKIDVVALVEASCADLEETGHPVTFETRLEHFSYACRPLSIKRALGNLLANGLAYGENVFVTVTRADDGGLWIDVSDDGPGIPVDQRDRVFEPFFRLEQSRNQETGGIGLGLAIARTAIRAHGGEIYLEDAPQGGLRARIYLPAPV
ncbi:histidine kinase [Thalassospira profundimaris]|uniref:histidine kinase n=1 Tax=Thalassospira profundimaris TaxID=502049 RepID=A0A367XLG1_9PROT|nr:ATP-binding protein [Thalassospira profundimaris]RCK53631.1 histidine kinase [Thalassospira profundimaris]